MSFNDPEKVLWFASCNNSKPGLNLEGQRERQGEGGYECWTLVSTPNYAVDKIIETPMQDPGDRE